MRAALKLVVSLGVAVIACATVSARVAAQSIEPFSVVRTPGGELAPGRYNCKGEYNLGGYTYKVVELVSATQYAWRGAKRRLGGMTYDAKHGDIRFATGPLAKVFTGKFGRREDGKAIFILVDTRMAPRAGAYDYCVRVAGS